MKASRAEISPAMRELSTWIANAIRKPLPREVAERAKVHLVDTYAAMISGSRLLPGRKAIEYVKARGGNPEAGVVGTRIVTSIPNAVLANAMLAHADETDDTHPPSRTHPGSGVVPAALAIGERDRLPGRTVLRAIVLGYDVCARIMLAVDEVHFRRTGHHPSAFGRIFGAAAAAGALLNLDARQARFLLSYAAQQAAGLSTVYRDAEHIEKASLSGMPAHNGATAALMAAAGFTGVDDVFTGERSFFYAFAPEADRSRLSNGLGRDFEILRCGIKRWPAGGPIQGPLHVLRDLMRDHAFKGGDVERLVARMPEKDLHSVNNRDMPDICVQHLLAVMLLDGTVTFKSAHDYTRMRSPNVLALRRRVEAVGDPKLNDPQRRWRCVMEITLKDGRRLAHQTMAAKGTSEDPLTRADEEEKALDLMAPVLGRQRSRALLAALWNVEKIRDIRALRRLAST